MTLAEAMFAYLSTLSVGDHVYPWRLPKDEELPAITFQIIPAAGPVRVHDDVHSGTPTGSLFMQTRVQWTCWHRTYLQCDQLGQELRHALHGFQGDMGGLQIGSIILDVEIDSYEEDVRVYRRIIDGMVRYNDIIAVGS